MLYLRFLHNDVVKYLIKSASIIKLLFSSSINIGFGFRNKINLQMSKVSGTKRKAESDGPKAKKKAKVTEDETLLDKLQDAAHRMRIDSIKMTDAAGSGHPTSCASMAELISAIFFHPDGMNFDPHNPRSFANDKFVLSKGHAAPILYSAWAEAGHFKKEDLLRLRKVDCDLEGHPTPRLDFVDVATGSLGQGLNAACGMAYSMKYFEKVNNRVFVLQRINIKT